jgi:hypothetical protein
VDKQTGAKHPVTAARNVTTPYGPNVDGLFPKAYVNILGQKFSLELIWNKIVRETRIFRRKWR